MKRFGPMVTLMQGEFSNRIRCLALAMIYHAGSGHPGGALSCADILSVLFGKELEWAPEMEQTQDRHRLILSKGHACPALYAAAAECGLLSRRELGTFRQMGSRLQGHPCSCDLFWLETSTGSLGQGFSVAVGTALGLRYLELDSRVYVILGDGELQEGQVWEAAMSASHLGLTNLCAVVDYNKLQSDDWNRNILGLEPLAEKWKAFNWAVFEVDGHDEHELAETFASARREQHPSLLLAHTTKGRGVSFMENSPLWHGSVKLRESELRRALQDLGVDQARVGSYVDGSIFE